MTWATRIRIIVGTILVIVIAALATYKLNESKGIAASDSAKIVAKTYTVGTPYAGLVVDQKVDVGDAVKAGQPLFVIDSPTLQYDVKQGFAKPATEASQVDEQGRLVVLATADGTVTRIQSERGTFVQSATDLATVQRANTLSIVAEYTLTPKEYARVSKNAAATVTLPNQRSFTAHVTRIKVDTKGGEAQAVMTLTSSSLKEGAQNGLVAAGTPVDTALHLQNNGFVTRTAEDVKSAIGGIFG